MTVAVLVAPHLLEATVRSIDAAARLPGVRLGLVSHEPVDRLPPALRPPAPRAQRGPHVHRGPRPVRPLGGAVVHGRLSGPRERRHSAAAVCERGRGQGRGTAVEALSRLLTEDGEHVVVVGLAAPGEPRRDRRAPVLGDGRVVVRHPDLATTPEIADRFVGELHLHAG